MTFDPLGNHTSQSLTSTSRKSVFLKLKRPSGLMTPTEWDAYELLQHSVVMKKYRYLAFPQVHLMQVVDIDVPGLLLELARRKVWPEYMKRVESEITKQWQFMTGWRSLDFLICDNAGMVVGSIEIDDPRHSADQATIASDAIKNIVFASIGKPLLRLTNAQVSTIHALPQSHWTTVDNELRVSRQSWNSFVGSLK
ncbi:TPA: DUF2726 domain-containing protein [Stenotrophomonas maltophilia]|uniref:DUF2726 domain-containing protein n=1 Tax=Stenotrophomonas maltophilia TaxID=40324 RepID=UPI000D6E8A8F|nr:DUF2726 domain-containing protein [Stenotrophomonas maltophilia]MBH1606114.1 DUF2726 domain-containing protein [Stenotrophomonas maltophilia]MCO7496517.1 DUF2726 domain-containing protein [Stenotrophomonas maltophilia]PWQ85669.1 hypothetical protein DKY64_11890 [Stenotrophomonas maltophilia]HDS1661865.1 DUF2726 domain-containing protein [Stenotrophomonas maltophilia]HDS1833797.1 DUF2726 domain-containing protein [Stenotrophomonas maltophilia]